ncbi:cobalt-precorrin-5B (C(1))-methyltransferase CbiD [Desulfospira joergensenii]|uniref:cobalt-precorrin-5B (C(1))-methyltransferase CbiD n=1 Tax=Desulfospira joergensenii TaxID=53329 RepID=UPI0003B7062C|nr:cobalt-precorrin-5B (C(1))-methyltransferase CbiD [Desulfospira joergensenii]
MDSKKLKKGFTTGAAASAAVKAALETLISGNPPQSVVIDFLTKGTRTVPVERVSRISSSCCEAVIIKDAGDDPDITHKAEIGARVLLKDSEDLKITITGGQGVGKVTKPGLELGVGEPAINPGPREMIFRAVHAVLEGYSGGPSKGVEIEVFVPKGEELAKKTLNARLGILGGISILGTTGIVTPLSHEAYIATIRAGIAVAAARDIHTLVFTTGRRSERFAMDMFPGFGEEAFIQTGDFFKAAIDAAVKKEIKEIIYTVFFGKAVKMALGFEHTHAAKSELTLKRLASWTEKITKDSSLAGDVCRANTARHAFSHIYPDHPGLIAHVGSKMLESAGLFAGGRIRFRAVILDFEGRVAFDSNP